MHLRTLGSAEQRATTLTQGELCTKVMSIASLDEFDRMDAARSPWPYQNVHMIPNR